MGVLASLLLVGGMVGQALPSQAGPWNVIIEFRCKIVVADPLVYPVFEPAGKDTSYTINCGKGKPNPHPFVVNDTFCHATTVSANGKKPMDQPQTGLGNCNISGGGNLFAANCGRSSGTVNWTITFKPSGKEVTATGTWPTSAADNMPITGTVKGADFTGKVQASPDVQKKEQSCLPPPGATDFKIQGRIKAAGIKP